MKVSFVPITLPDDQDRLIAFLKGNEWPFHVNAHLKERQVLKMIDEGIFGGSNHQSFWILDDSSADVGFMRLFDLDDIEDGYPLFDLRIRPKYRGNGIGKTAVQWLTNYLFESFPKLDRIAGTTRSDNSPMRKTFLSCGYVKEGHYRKDWSSSNGEIFDTVKYAILREDWASESTTPVPWNDVVIETEICLPKIIFECGWLLDSSICEISKSEMSEQAIKEISDRLSEFNESWMKLGEPLLLSTIEESGLHFKEKDIKAFLTCGPLSSHSHPLTLNVRNYLMTFNSNPSPLSEFVEQTLHELIHILLEDNVRDWPTPAIDRFSKDGFDVLAHLHLMALHRRSHERLGNKTTHLKDWYGAIGGDYKKTWSLISDDSTYSTLLEEVQTHFGSQL